jgi:hypothetical protein
VTRCFPLALVSLNEHSKKGLINSQPLFSLIQSR